MVEEASEPVPWWKQNRVLLLALAASLLLNVGCTIYVSAPTPPLDSPGPPCLGEDLSFDDIQCYEDQCSAEEDVVLITGGHSRRSEVLSLGGEPIECGPVADTPAHLADGYASFWKYKGYPIFCAEHHDQPCYLYCPSSNRWEPFPQLDVALGGFSGVLEIEDYLQFRGSFNGLGVALSNISDVYKSPYWSKSLEEIPVEARKPHEAVSYCSLRINDTHFMIIGGWVRTTIEDGWNKPINSVYTFNRESEVWTGLESMRENRSKLACGLVGGSKVIAAGGFTIKPGNATASSRPGIATASVEIFDLHTEKWLPGPDLPARTAEAASVQLQDTFLVVGGSTNEVDRFDTVYEYDLKSNDWLLRTERMTVGRAEPAVWKMPASFLNCK